MNSVFSTCLCLITLNLCHSQSDDMDSLFGHETGKIITPQEEQTLKTMYDSLDTNKDGKVSLNEFKSLNADIYSIVFDQMDLNQDDELRYNEMVHYYKEMIMAHPQPIFDETQNPEWSSLETEFNEITSSNSNSVQYNNDTQAEFLANILLSEIDTDNKNYITSTQFNEYNIEQDWADYFEDNNNDRVDISFDEFKNHFFNSIEYEIQHNLKNETQQELDELEVWYNDIQDDHSDAESILNEDMELIWDEHAFDDIIIHSDNTNHRRLLFGIFSAIKIVRKVTKFTRAINTIISPPKLEKSCDDKIFRDWTGKQFKITSKEICTSMIYNLCVDKSCGVDNDIFQQAIINSKWDWNNNGCNDKYLSASARTDDMKCSSGPNEVYKYISLGSIDLTFYNKLWDPSCKIHDMCYKNNGNTEENCDTQFKHNIETICELKYPFSANIIEKNACVAVAHGYYHATANFGHHKGGIDPANCLLN